MFDLPPPDPALEIVVASRGMSKGIAQTDGPQFVVRPELALGPVRLGAYAKNVTSTTSDGEAGLSIGIRAEGGGFDLTASAAWKRAIEPSSGSDRNAFELTATAARRLGRLSLRLTLIWSPDDLGGTEQSVYGETGASFAVARSTALSANLGRRERSGGPDYTAFNVGMTHNLTDWLSADIRLHDSSRSGLGEFYRARAVASLRLRF